MRLGEDEQVGQQGLRVEGKLVDVVASAVEEIARLVVLVVGDGAAALKHLGGRVALLGERLVVGAAGGRVAGLWIKE